MPSRVPVTNLRDAQNGGAPEFIGGDTPTDETVANPPYFLEDDDPEFVKRPHRRGLFRFVHIPPAGIATVDFVTLLARNISTTSRAYVNALLAPVALSVQMRVTSLFSTPVYGDALLVEDDAPIQLAPAIDVAGELSIAVTTTASVDLALDPTVELTPPPVGQTRAVLQATSAGVTVEVLEPTGHGYSSPPNAVVRGGVQRQLGFFESIDKTTLVAGSAVSGTLTVIGTLCRCEYAHNVAVGDGLVVNSEFRVVVAVSHDTNELTIDHGITGVTNIFQSWSYLPLLSASSDSQYRVGEGVLTSTGQFALRSSARHGLSAGDYVVYRATSGVELSNRVTAVTSDTEFQLERTANLSGGESATYRFVYLLAETEPGSAVHRPVSVVRVVRTTYGEEDAVVDLKGLGGRKLHVKNHNFYNRPGSYHDEFSPADAAVVLYGTVSVAHGSAREFALPIGTESVLEAELKPQPAPETQLLAGFPVNGGTATETGERPLLAVYERGARGRSGNVIYWGHYLRYSPENGTNFTQAINV